MGEETLAKIKKITDDACREVDRLWNNFQHGDGSYNYEFERMHALRLKTNAEMIKLKAEIEIAGLLAEVNVTEWWRK